MANKKVSYILILEYNYEEEKKIFEQWLIDTLYKINIRTLNRDIIVDFVRFYEECRNVTISN